MGAVTAYDTSAFLPPLPAGHPFPAAKYRLLRQTLERLPQLRLKEAPRADLPWVLAMHDPGYVARVLTGALSAAEQRRLGLPWSPELAERALRTCGATLAACRDALRSGLGLVLGGGSHHAHRSFGRGFCVFNDLAVAARWAVAQGVQRVLIVDCDVHPGDGTGALLRDEPRVFTLSVHARGNCVFGPTCSDLDVQLPDGCRDPEVLRALEAALSYALRRVEPELVLYVAGADPLCGDRLGRLAMSEEGLRNRDRLVFTLVRSLGAGLVVTLGGGYAEPVERTVRVHEGTVREAVLAAGVASG